MCKTYYVATVQDYAYCLCRWRGRGVRQMLMAAYEGGGESKSGKSCLRSLWMAPDVIFLVVSHANSVFAKIQSL